MPRTTGLVEASLPTRRSPYVFGLIFVVLAAGISIAGYQYYSDYQRRYRAEVERQLSAIADMKVAELADWRSERLGDAAILFKNDAFSSLVRRHFENPGDVEAQNQLRSWLGQVQAHLSYDRVILLDTQGIARVAVSDTPQPVAVHVAQDAAEALRSGKISFQDFHRDKSDGPIRLAMLVPILNDQAGGRPLGVVVLRIDPAAYLYPFINRWPTSSDTAETLLVRRDGNDALFLNELRFQKNTALTLRSPLTTKERPAVMAVLGQEGIVEGLDYRGMPVIAAIHAVPDSPWFLVARMDSSEVYGPLRERLWLTVVLVGILLLAAGAGSGLAWRQRSVHFYREKAKGAEALRASEIQYRRLFEAAKDGILILDAQTGMVVDVNPFLIELLGFPREHFLAKKVWELGFFKDVIANHDNFVELQQKGYVRYEDMPLMSADGRQLNVEFVSNVYLVNHHKVIQCNIRDITKRVRMEEEMQSKTALLEAQSETSIDGILAVDDQGKCILSNTRFGAMWNVPREMLDARDGDRILHHVLGQVNNPEDFLDKVRHLYAHKTELSRDEISLKDGRILDRYSSPLVSPNGKYFGRIWFFRDITQRKLAEERHSMILKTAMEGFWIIDLEGRILEVNDAFCRMTGYGHEELLRMSTPDLDAMESPEETADRIRGIVTVGKGWFETRHRRKDGRIIDVEVSVTYMGEPSKLMFSFARDVTERKWADESMRESEERFRTLVDAVTDYAYKVTVQDNRVVETIHGPGCLGVTGYSPEEFRADPKLWFQMVHLEDQPAVLDRASKLSSGQKVGPQEHRIIQKNGEIRWVRNTAVSRFDKRGKYVGYEGLIQDVTEYRRLQNQFAQAQKMEAIGQLAGGVAHDFRNQLTVIKGYGEMLLRRELIKDGGKEPLEHILKAADRSATIAGQLLAFSRRQMLRPEVANVNSVTNDMMKSLAQTLGEDIRLSVMLGGNLWNIHVDIGQFQQALLNLVLNARDAMPKGGPLAIETENIVLDEAFVSGHAGASAGRYVVLMVRDAGAGMSPETLSRLFEPFFTTKPVGEGTGLGLAMVHGFVAQSGGFIEVQSRLDKGTTFRLYFPAVEDVAESARPLSKAADLPQGSGTVLVVEDEDAIRRILLETLGECGYTVSTVGNAQEAMARIGAAEKKIDLLITDVVMPGGSGPELAKQFQAARPGMPVLLISGHTGKALAGHGVVPSDVNLLLKPFSFKTLAETVRKILDQPRRP